MRSYRIKQHFGEKRACCWSMNWTPTAKQPTTPHTSAPHLCDFGLPQARAHRPLTLGPPPSRRTTTPRDRTRTEHNAQNERGGNTREPTHTHKLTHTSHKPTHTHTHACHCQQNTCFWVLGGVVAQLGASKILTTHFLALYCARPERERPDSPLKSAELWAFTHVHTHACSLYFYTTFVSLPRLSLFLFAVFWWKRATFSWILDIW